MLRLRLSTLLPAALLIAACSGGSDGGSPPAASASSTAGSSSAAAGVADAAGAPGEDVTPADVEAGRHDESWRRFADEDRRERASAGTQRAGQDSAGGGGAAPSSSGARGGSASESWDDIGPGSVQVARAALPLQGEAEGPSVLAVQILLDRARFSPGIADGYWGKNTEKAVYWLQSERGLEPTGTVDARTLELLRREAGSPGALTRKVTLSAELAAGPFVTIPDDVYQQADMDCLCYTSPGEKLAERFHTTRDVLSALNPGVDLDGLAEGSALTVPDHGGPVDSLGARDVARGSVDHIVISDGGHYLHAMAADGSILYHFPSTLGSQYAPSPSGHFSIEAIARDPEWHYQPGLLTGEPDTLQDAMVPAGPNNPVGVVWMDLSKEHYGIHGTAAPSTIGYVTSHGCVRLTNWDAAFLADRVEPGTPVRFRDASGREGDGNDGGSGGG